MAHCAYLVPQHSSVGDRQAAITVATFRSLEKCMFFKEATMFALSWPLVYNTYKEEMSPVPQTEEDFLI